MSLCRRTAISARAWTTYRRPLSSSRKRENRSPLVMLSQVQYNYDRANAACHHIDPQSASITLAKLQNPVRKSFEEVRHDLTEVYTGLGRFQKILDKVWRGTSKLSRSLSQTLTAHLPYLELQGDAPADLRLRRSLIPSKSDQSSNRHASASRRSILCRIYFLS